MRDAQKHELINEWLEKKKLAAVTFIRRSVTTCDDIVTRWNSVCVCGCVCVWVCVCVVVMVA